MKNPNGFSQLFIDSSRLDECLEYMISHDFKNIIINSYQGFAIKDLIFLSRIDDFVEGIVVSETHFENTEIINTLHKLKFLGITDNKKSVIDLSNFPDLETCAVEYSTRLKGLESSKLLKSLTISHYKSASEDFTNFPQLLSLQSLNIMQAKLSSLNGIEKLMSLEKLMLFGMPKLKTIKNLGALSKTLEQIEIENCKNITDFETLSHLLNLKKLIVLNSGAIKSLNFIKSLKNLDFFSFVGTNVLDGNLSPCIGLKYVGFDNKKHYSHKRDDLRQRFNGENV